MNIAILTLSLPENDNYGAALQGWALKNYCNNGGGHTARIIFIGEDKKLSEFILDKINAANKKYPKNKSFKYDLKRSYRKIRILYEIFSQFYKHKIILKYAKRYKKFTKFLIDECYLTSSSLKVRDIRSGKLKDDLIIVGSDCVWFVHSGQPHSMPINVNKKEGLFFGYFNLHKNQKRIAYSVSQGIFPKDDYSNFFVNSAMNFSNISVREAESAEYLLNCGVKQNIEVTVDPTLLLNRNDYDELAENAEVPSSVKKLKSKYILVYILKPNDKQYISEYVERAKKFFKLPIVCVNKRKEFFINNAIIIGDECGPKEFIALFKDAEYFITNSFHGMVFASIYHVRFTGFRRHIHDFRQLNLVKELGLESRLLIPSDSKNDDLFSEMIDFDRVDSNRLMAIKDSIAFLKRSGV